MQPLGGRLKNRNLNVICSSATFSEQKVQQNNFKIFFYSFTTLLL